MPKPSVVFVESVVTRTVPAIRGLKIPAANPMQSIAAAIPEKDFVASRSRIAGMYAR